MSAQAIYSGPTSLPFTGERMVPHASDIATELFHWQRYLFFRSWYVGKKVVDAASGEGYGTNYIANFASQATGIDICEDAVDYASSRYGRRSSTPPPPLLSFRTSCRNCCSKGPRNRGGGPGVRLLRRLRL